MSRVLLLLACLGCACSLLGRATAAAPPSASKIDITVPESVHVEGEDSYICITKPLPDKPLKLVGVEPMAEQKVVHHILLFGECVFRCWCARACCGVSSRMLCVCSSVASTREALLAWTVRRTACKASAHQPTPRLHSLTLSLTFPCVLCWHICLCLSLLYCTGCDEPYVKPKDGKEAVWECKHQPTCGGRQDAVL